MRAVRIHRFGGPDVLQLDEIARPDASGGDILIQVEAASVNPVDYKIRRGQYPRVRSGDLPATLGRDVAGIVLTGGGGFEPGEAVIAHLDWSSGGYADVAAATLKGVCRKPSTLNPIRAAGVPLAATTAYQGLMTHGRLEAGQTVLIQGASGGVGAYAVQFAHLAGAYVYATASSDSAASVRGYGADRVIDYKTERFEDVARNVDLVFDLVGGDTQTRSFAVIKPEGSLISAVAQPDEILAAKSRVRIVRFMAEPNGQQLARFAAMIDEGRLQTTLSKVFPLEQAAAAHRFAEDDHPRGKVVLDLRGAEA